MHDALRPCVVTQELASRSASGNASYHAWHGGEAESHGTIYALEAGGQDHLSGVSRRSSQDSEDGAAARLASLVAASQTLGFPTLDAAIKAYYTEDLSGDSSTADLTELVRAQRDGRRRHLRYLLVALHHSAKLWWPEESRGLREGAARIAEGVYATELKLLRDDLRFTPALAAVLSAIHNLQDLLEAHLPSQSRDAVSPSCISKQHLFLLTWSVVSHSALGAVFLD